LTTPELADAGFPQIINININCKHNLRRYNKLEVSWSKQEYQVWNFDLIVQLELPTVVT
jgi:hypothetical protein